MNDALRQALFLIEKNGSWLALKKQLDEKGLTQSLGPEGIAELIKIWQEREAEKLTDYQLISELDFWAKGGKYKDHLLGYNAISPEELIENAKKRGWFIKEMKSGGVIVSPPSSSPLHIKF